MAPKKKTRQNYQQLQARPKTLCLDVASGGRSVDDFCHVSPQNIRWPLINREAIDEPFVPDLSHLLGQIRFVALFELNYHTKTLFIAVSDFEQLIFIYVY